MELIIDYQRPIPMARSVPVQFYLDEGELVVFKDSVKLNFEKDILCEIHAFIDYCIDMDSWKHSWHINTAKINIKAVRDRIREIVNEKIEDREKEIKELKAVEILFKYQIIDEENGVLTIQDVDDMPF